MLQDIGLGILSWYGYETLQNSLESYAKHGLLDLFSEKVIYFQEIDEQAHAVAKKYGFQAFGNNKNAGIFAGFKGLAKSMNSEYLLLMENDLVAETSSNSALPQLQNGKNYLQNDTAHIINFYMRGNWSGVDAARHIPRILKQFPPADASSSAKFFGLLNRIFKARKSARLQGLATEVFNAPYDRFPLLQHENDTDFVLMPTQCRQLIPCCFMVKKHFFENVIISHVDKLDVEKLPKRYLANGMKDLQGGVQYKSWWNYQPYTIASAPGIFNHHRIGDRGY